jgi:hypothetical protein
VGWWWKSTPKPPNATTLTWLDAAPLVLVHASLAGTWRGAPAESDRMKRAGELGIVDIDGGQALLFGDEGTRTTWLARESGGLVVRWVHATNEAQVLAAAEKGADATWIPTGTLFTTKPGDHLLFDARAPGADTSHRRVAMKLTGGRYDVSIARIDDGEASLSILRLYPLPG